MYKFSAQRLFLSSSRAPPHICDWESGRTGEINKLFQKGLTASAKVPWVRSVHPGRAGPGQP